MESLASANLCSTSISNIAGATAKGARLGFDTRKPSEWETSAFAVLRGFREGLDVVLKADSGVDAAAGSMAVAGRVGWFGLPVACTGES